MKKWYRTAAALMVGACTTMQVNAQTHYGMGAGTVGAAHSFFGVDAGKVNTGPFNTFIGQNSGVNNMTGESNVFVGHNTGSFYNTTGSENVFMGTLAGYFNNGNNNTFVGFAAGSGNLTGNRNTFIGQAGSSLQKGDNNVMVGHESGHVAGSCSGNAFFGNQSGYHNSGDNNSFFGHKAGFFNSAGKNNTYIGYQSGASAALTNATAIGANALVTASNSVVLGNSVNVGIGYSAPSFQLHLSTANAAKAGSPDWIVASDRRLKKNITDFTDGLDLLKQIHPVWFQYNGQAGIETGEKKFVGIIAQEMQQIAPYTIGTFTYQDSLGNKTEYLDYDANAVTYILINSVKEQQRVIEQKDAELKEVNAQVAALEKSQQALITRLEALEQNRSSAIGFQKTGESQEAPYLEQNVPNGFVGKTVIKYFVPSSVKEAVINIYNTGGTQVSTHRITERGAGELQLSAETYRSGLHVYDLVIDGKVIGNRKMLIE